jgi:MOSC domain-containing protein YiiM
LSGHDGAYIRTSRLQKDSEVFNWRSWTGISQEELAGIENDLGLRVPSGCLLENIIVSGIPNFSKLPPTSRLVFPGMYEDGKGVTQAILAVWEENSPCDGVGKRLEAHHKQPGLSARFIKAAQNKRGVMGLVLSPGEVRVGDTVLVYPPVQ